MRRMLERCAALDVHQKTVTDMSLARKNGALILRGVLIMLLVLAMAGMKSVKKGDSLAVPEQTLSPSCCGGRPRG